MSGKGGKRDRRASFNFAVSTIDHGKLRILSKKLKFENFCGNA